MRPKKLKEKYQSEHKTIPPEKPEEKYQSDQNTPNLPKQKEKFLLEIRAKRQPSQALQPNLRAQINPTLRVMTIQHRMPLIMESTFQGLESNQERNLVGLLPGLTNI